MLFFFIYLCICILSVNFSFTLAPPIRWSQEPAKIFKRFLLPVTKLFRSRGIFPANDAQNKESCFPADNMSFEYRKLVISCSLASLLYICPRQFPFRCLDLISDHYLSTGNCRNCHMS